MTQVLLRCADEQVVRVASGQRFQRPLPGPPVLSSSLNMPGGLLQSSSPSLYIHHPPPRLWCVSPGLLKCLNATQMRLYFRPGRSSLHLGHGGAVPGQDLHQFVPPVKRVSEPAQLARDLLGGGDLWGRQITSDRSDHTRRSLKKTAQAGAGGADTHLFAPFYRGWKRGLFLLKPCAVVRA